MIFDSATQILSESRQRFLYLLLLIFVKLNFECEPAVLNISEIIRQEFFLLSMFFVQCVRTGVASRQRGDGVEK